MQNSRFIQTLKTLSYIELKWFLKLVESPFFIRDDKVQKLATILFKLFPDFDAAKLKKDYLFKKLYPNKAYDDQQMRLLISALNKALEMFLIQQQLSHDEVLMKIYFMRSLRQRKLESQYEKVMHQTLILMEKEAKKDDAYLKKKQLLEEEVFEYLSVNSSRQMHNNIQGLLSTIDQQFLYSKLKYACDALNRKNILSSKYDLSFLETIVNYVENQDQENLYAGIPIYLSIYKLLTHDAPDHFYVLKQQLHKKVSHFPKNEVKDMYAYLQNYCIKQVNLGNEPFLNELFETYTVLLKEEIIVRNKKMYLFDFKNIATVAIRLGKYKWVEEFTHNYKDYIDFKYRQSAIGYNMARIYFYQDDFKKAYQAIADVDYADVYYELGCRVLMMKINFEEDNTTLFDASINSLKMYLGRNKSISDYQKKTYKNLLRFTNRLFYLKGQNKKIELLKEELERMKEVADRTWLLKKVKEY